MKILGLILTIIATITSVHAQVTTEIKSGARTNVMLSIRNLLDGLDEYSRPDLKACTARTYTGTIVKVHYDDEYGLNMDGFTLVVKTVTGSWKGEVGLRKFFNLQGYEELAPPQIDWLPTLIATGKRVRVDAYLCGVSGRYVVVNNVIAMSVKEASSQTKKNIKRQGNRS